MKKFIFDLDYTLLIPDWSREDKFFEDNMSPKEFNDLMKVKQQILNEYEDTAPKYDLNGLSQFYKKHGFNLSPDLIKNWMEYNGKEIIDELNDGAVELLEFLKQNNKKIVLLTNWFSVTQIRRLERVNLLKYFDELVCGDDAMKPSKESFDLAVSDTPKNECIMIGDSKTKDYEGALNYGINAYLIDEEHSLKDLLEDLKNMALHKF